MDPVYEIDTAEDIELGGVRQNIRIRTKDKSRPLLLFLHGGPGVPDRNWVMQYQSGLADCATMVCWDQRGAGLSYRKDLSDEELTVERFVADAAELCRLLMERFGQDGVYIVGHSWGSLLGSLLAEGHPELVKYYVGMGQFVSGPENEQLSYGFVVEQARKNRNEKALRELEKAGAPKGGLYASQSAMMTQRKWLSKFGGAAYGKDEAMIQSLVVPLLKSPEYPLRKLPGFYRGSMRSLSAMWPQIVKYDLREQVKSLAMPALMTEGRHDYNTPVSLAEQWFAALDAPKKQWVWFERSAHSPIKEEPETWQKAVVAALFEPTT